MKKTLIAWLLPALLASACLEIDGQDVTVRYDEAADRIDMLFLHRGLFAEGGNGSSREPLKKALDDLADARRTGKVAFWNNWPLALDPSADHKPPMSALVDHIDVENGDLFTDPRGVLCAYQFVRIRDAKAFVAKLNLLLELVIQSGFSGDGLRGLEGKHRFDDDTRELLREFLRAGEKLLVVERGHIELRLPFSAQDHAWFKAQLDDHLMDNLPREILRRRAVATRREVGGDVTDTSVAEATVVVEGPLLRQAIEQAPGYRFFWDNDLSLQRTLERTTVGIGVAGRDELHIHRAEDGLYHEALLQRLRDDGVEIEDGLPDQELRRRFDDFRGRDARLPPRLAAARG